MTTLSVTPTAEQSTGIFCSVCQYQRLYIAYSGSKKSIDLGQYGRVLLFFCVIIMLRDEIQTNHVRTYIVLFKKLQPIKF